ncbi:MAG TPA: hypothetical protein VG742_20115 [Dongiaceae bacterium]|nr:hypothetical protein [Dongiaceae bacterium]
MTRDTTPESKTKKSEAKANEPREVALVVPHAAADAGITFESAMEVLDQDLRVHKLWQEQPQSTPKPSPGKTPA